MQSNKILHEIHLFESFRNVASERKLNQVTYEFEDFYSYMR